MDCQLNITPFRPTPAQKDLKIHTKIKLFTLNSLNLLKLYIIKKINLFLKIGI